MGSAAQPRQWVSVTTAATVETDEELIELVSGDMGDFDSPLDGADTPVLAGCIRDLVHDALLRLPEIQRTVVVLRFFEERTVPEVARALGRTEGAVKQLQVRAVRRLGTLLPVDALLN